MSFKKWKNLNDIESQNVLILLIKIFFVTTIFTSDRSHFLYVCMSIREGLKKKVIFITLGSDPPPLKSDENIFYFFGY